MDNTTFGKAVNEHQSPLLDQKALDLLAVNNPAMVAVVRAPDLSILYVNPQFSYYLGYSKDDLEAGLSFSDLIEDYQHDHLQNQLKHVSGSIDARSGYVIYRLKGKGGKVQPYYLYAGPF